MFGSCRKKIFFRSRFLLRVKSKKTVSFSTASKEFASNSTVTYWPATRTWEDVIFAFIWQSNVHQCQNRISFPWTLPILQIKVLHHAVLIKTYCEDIPMLFFHPSQKHCSIFSKRKSVAQPWKQSFVQRWLIFLSVQVQGNSLKLQQSDNVGLFAFHSFMNLNQQVWRQHCYAIRTFSHVAEKSHGMWATI